MIALFWGGIASIGGALSGCARGPLEQQIFRVTDRASDRIDGAFVHERDWPPAGTFKAPGQYETDLETVNPTAAELTYEPADPARDPGEILADFALHASGTLPGQDLRVLTLADAWRISQDQAREYLSAEEDFIFAAIRLLIERHLWGPRFFDTLATTLGGDATEGTHQAAVTVVNTLRATKRLPYGGQVEADWVWQATEQLREAATEDYTQSSRLVLSGTIPLLRGAGLVAREGLIQAERNLIYGARSFERFRREFFVSIARDYFNLLEQQASIANQKRRLVSVYEQLEETQAKFKAGMLTLIDVSNVQNTLLATRATLDDLRDSYITQLGRFKIRLGIPVTDHVDVAPLVFDLTEPAISMEEAMSRALALRLDLQNQRDMLDDARRSVAIARNQILPDLDINADVTIPTDPDDPTGGLALDPDEIDYSVGATLSLPLDRKSERLDLREAFITVQRQMRELDAFVDTVILDARAARRFIERARAALELAEERVRITQLRKEEQFYKRDETTTQERLDTENALIDAQNDRDNAETNLRIAVLDYLLATGQLRVKPDGSLDPIPGMKTPPVRIFAELENLSEWYKDPPLVEVDPDHPPDVTPGAAEELPGETEVIQEDARDVLDDTDLPPDDAEEHVGEEASPESPPPSP